MHARPVKYRILYVDDEPGLLEIGKLFLEDGGQFSVDISLSASAGLDLLASATYDAIISDYQMPGMDGIEFLKKVRASGDTIPFILFTGRGREEVVIQALNEGADFYLQKGGEPVSQFAELAHKIRQSVQKRQAEIMIRDHERREADIINFLPDATFAIDIHGKVIAWNRAIEEMTGILAGEMIGKDGYEHALPFYHERRPVTVDLVLQEEQAVIEKYPVMKKEGSSLFSEIYIPHLNKGRGAHLWFTASPLYDTAGNLTGAIESIRDITERKRTEEALNLENQRIESLLSLSRMDTTTDSAISAQVVEDAVRLTGSTIGYLATLNDDESVMTMQYWSQSAHESCKIVHKPLVYAVEKTGLWGEAVRQRKPVITNDYAAVNPLKRGTPKGHVPLVRHMNIPVFEGDHIVAIAGVGNKDTDYNEGDVHELQLLMQGWWQILGRKRDEEDIRRSNAILKTQQETSPDGIITIDEQTKILNYNQTFIAIWGIPVDLLASGKYEPVLQHIAGQVIDPDTFLTRVRSLYAHKEEKSSGELLLKDGRILEWFSTPMLGEKEEYFGRVWFFRDITRRRMDEDAVRAAQEKFSTIYRQSPDVIWISELESGRFIDVNDAAERIFGYTREEFIGRNSLDLGIWVNPSDRSVLVQGIRKEGRVDRSEIILRRKNGEMFHAECSASMIFIQGTEYLIITIRDISGMKRAEDALKESEDKFRLLVENSHDIIYTLSAEGVFLFVSPVWTTQLGHPVTQVTGHSFQEFVHPDDIPGCMVFLQSVILKGQRQDGIEYRVKHRDGTWNWHTSSAVPFRDETGTIAGFYGIARDITEQKKAEEVRRASEDRFRHLIETTSDWIWETDSTGNYTYVSPQIRDLLGYEPDEIIGKTPFHLMPPEESEKITSLFTGYITARKPITRLENINLHKDGRRIVLETSGVPFFDNRHTFLGYRGIDRDITERKHAEEALRESEYRFRELFNSMSSGVAVYRAVDDGADFVFVDLNPGAEKIEKTRKQDIIGRPVSEVFPGVVEFGIMDVFRRVWRTGEPERHPISMYKDERIASWRENYIYRLPSGEVVAVYDDVTERKEAEESIRKSFAILKGVVESPKDVVIFALDRQYRYMAFNENHRRTMKQIWGADIVLGNSMPGYMQLPEDRKKAIINFDRALAGESFSVIEAYGDTAFERRWYEDTYNPVTDENGNVIGLTLFLRDITEWKHAEEAIRESEEKFRGIFNNINDGIELHEMREDGLPGKYLEVNDVTCQMLGYNHEELLQHSPLDFATDYHNRPIEEIGRELLTTGHSRFETGHRNRDGGVIPVEINAHVIVLHDKTKVLAVVRDITERKLAEENLRESEKKYRQLFEMSGDALFVTENVTGKIIEVNEAAVRMYGYSRNELHTLCNSDLSAEPGKTLGVMAIDSEDRVTVPLRYHRKKDGTVFPVEITVSFFTWKGRRVNIGSIRDITERKLAEDALRSANKKLNLLSGITRHDINNQLLTARGFLKVLHQKIPDPVYEDYFTRIEEAWSRISSMIQFTKEYEQIGVSAPVWQDCRVLADTAVKDISLGNALLKNDLPANAEVFADPLIVRVFYNLIDNSIRYGVKISRIHFFLQESAGCCCIICEDDGVGVPVEEKERIFDRGFGKNTGMGLWFAREILSITNITITETGEPGKGARFEINVPKGACRCPDKNKV